MCQGPRSPLVGSCPVVYCNLQVSVGRNFLSRHRWAAGARGGDPDSRVPRLHRVPQASATPDESCSSNSVSFSLPSMPHFRSQWPVSSAAKSSRLHGLFLPHREALSGPSSECDTALWELQRVPDMAPRAWPPSERDLSCGL